MTRPIGKYERAAIERHEQDLKTAAARGLRYDPVAAERPVQFIEGFCKHHKGEWAGKPLLLEDWQKNAIRWLFGWRRADGTRRFRTAWLEVARKNGKTELAAAIALYMLIADGEAGAEVYSAATTREQASIVFKAAQAMVGANPNLARFVSRFKKSLVVERTGSSFQPLASEANTLDGLNPNAVIGDEVHVWTDPRLWIVLDTALGARRQPLMLAITTAGVYDPESIGWQQHDYATKVLNDVFDDDAFFSYICAIDDAAEAYDIEAVRKANPNLGISPKRDYIEKQIEKAKRQPSFVNEYLRLHCNIWTQQVTRWLSLDRWNECDGRPFGADELEGRACFGGLDLSTKLDLTAFVLAFPRSDGLDLLARFWLPEETVAEAARKGQRHYETWAREGWLTTTPGDTIDYDFIRAEVNELGRRFKIQEIAFDPWNATAIATKLGSEDGFVMVETRQGYKTLSEPSKDLEARIVARRVRHGGNPLLRWCVSNVAIDTDPAGNIKPAKDKSTGRIDGVVAAVMALSRLNLQGDTTSPYEAEGLLIL